ncbi:MAG TPA: DUF2274 domain-containing protein [Asticcacaulis sp.]|nr:DUF2274 domain-containing protein [Asticcacaulis sp.]
MAEIRLPRLPDRTPVKVQISLPADLHQSLQDYAAHYEATYAVKEPLSELIPFMLEAFLSSDRSFSRNTRK